MNCRGHTIITRKGTTPVPTMPSGIDAKKSPQKKKVDLFINTLKSTLTLLILSIPSIQIPVIYRHWYKLLLNLPLSVF